MATNKTRRQLVDAHDDIVLRHDEEHRWCLDCHDAANRDRLHLASGELVPFEESYRLCGQCHGEKYRDWRAGLHGSENRTSGTAPKEYPHVRALPQSASAALQSARARSQRRYRPRRSNRCPDGRSRWPNDPTSLHPGVTRRQFASAWPRRRPRVGFSPPAVLGACMKFRDTGCARRSRDVGATTQGTIRQSGDRFGCRARIFRACSSRIALDLSRCNGNRLCVDACVDGKQPISRSGGAVDSCAVR